VIVVIVIAATHALASDNGLFRTPPLGYCSWFHFRCSVDCVTNPSNCLSEENMIAVARAIRDRGLLAAGYKLFQFDDCVFSRTRNAGGGVNANSSLFPGGFSQYAEKLQALGFEIGAYSDVGSYTCGGYPAINDRPREFIADWDKQLGSHWRYLKADGCYATLTDYKKLYTNLFTAITNSSNKKVALSCSWPAYVTDTQQKMAVLQYAKTICNAYRVYDDIQGSWAEIKNIIEWVAANQAGLSAAHGPGSWVDMDMVIAGSSELSEAEARAQFAIWAGIWAGPLMIGGDPRTMHNWAIDLLTNRAVIEINQNAGKMGSRIASNGPFQLWRRTLVTNSSSTTTALVFFNTCDSCGYPQPMSASLEQVLGASPSSGAALCADVFAPNVVLAVNNTASLNVHVENHGVRFFKCRAV
jgi:hypothetical protein